MSNTTTHTNDNAPAVAEAPTAVSNESIEKARVAVLAALGEINAHPIAGVIALSHVIGEVIAIGEGDVERALATVGETVRAGYQAARKVIEGVAEKL